MGAPQHSETKKRATLLRYFDNQCKSSKTAREMGVPRKTLEEWVNALTPDEVEAYQERVNEDAKLVWQAVRDAALDRILCEMDEMPRQQLPMVAGIAQDKINLAEGKPTSIAGQVSDDPDKLAAELTAILGGKAQKAV